MGGSSSYLVTYDPIDCPKGVCNGWCSTTSNPGCCAVSAIPGEVLVSGNDYAKKTYFWVRLIAFYALGYGLGSVSAVLWP